MNKPNKLHYSKKYGSFYMSFVDVCTEKEVGITFKLDDSSAWTYTAPFSYEEYEEVADMFDILKLIEERISDRGAT